jgi:enamine deaminase RidA (YjgF/YER057c/UK114 family)
MAGTQRLDEERLEQRAASLGLVLNLPPSPGRLYVPYTRVGSLVYISGSASTRPADGLFVGHDWEIRQRFPDGRVA